jgi:hypothetical protein
VKVCWSVRTVPVIETGCERFCTVKVPLASAKRPVPPVMVKTSVSSDAPDGVS